MRKIIDTLVVINLIGLIALMVYQFMPKNDGYVYIDTFKVYEGFTMKQKLQKQLESVLQQDAGPLDSLRLEVKMLTLRYNQQPSNEGLKKLLVDKGQELRLREQEVKYKQEELAEKYDAQIWSQINQYISEYGKEHQCNMILGASGNGTLMYGEDTKNKTSEMIQYINKKYKEI
jgi:outer membrane protein